MGRSASRTVCWSIARARGARTDGGGWKTVADGLSLFEPVFTQISDPNLTPEIAGCAR